MAKVDTPVLFPWSVFSALIFLLLCLWFWIWGSRKKFGGYISFFRDVHSSDRIYQFVLVHFVERFFPVKEYHRHFFVWSLDYVLQPSADEHCLGGAFLASNSKLYACAIASTCSGLINCTNAWVLFCKYWGRTLLKKSSPFKLVRRGRGKILLMTDNTNFRAFWFGTNRILLNMLFHSNIM